MFGAALGDIVGSLYEFDPIKRKDFLFLDSDMDYTDDTIMTAAVLEALMESDINDEDTTKSNLIRRMQEWGERYPYPTGAYGSMFSSWLRSSSPKPYGSWGNGSAMRVSGAGWLYSTIDDTRKAARLSALVTHNHEEGIKGAEATASAIFLARSGKSKEEIKAYIEKEFCYDLSRPLSSIRPSYFFDGSCQGSVPESIICFLEGRSTEDTIRNAISLGGDADTMGAIAGSIAEAYWKEDLAPLVRPYLPDDIYSILSKV
ncbi:MAG: ADP-ribosylglycohydrolase family protein [Candidatus Ornithospirochaeta sp.]